MIIILSQIRICASLHINEGPGGTRKEEGEGRSQSSIEAGGEEQANRFSASRKPSAATGGRRRSDAAAVLRASGPPDRVGGHNGHKVGEVRD